VIEVGWFDVAGVRLVGSGSCLSVFVGSFGFLPASTRLAMISRGNYIGTRVYFKYRVRLFFLHF
jgi:hypothetical protein